MEHRLRKELEDVGCTIEPCGSRVTCNPVPEGSDEDWLVEVPADREGWKSKKNQQLADVVGLLSEMGFHWESDEHYQKEAVGGFMSFRKGNQNLIVTANPEFAHKHRTATALCTRLNLRHKDDRIALLHAVLYGNHWKGKL